MEDTEQDKAIYLPRLSASSYRGKAFVHWTQTVMTAARDGLHRRFTQPSENFSCTRKYAAL